MRRPNVPVLTSLRFPAALAIVLYHFLSFVIPCPLWAWNGLGAGVSFFYVLSGFILYYNYADLTDRGAFWVARFGRIWPVHIFMLVLTLAFIPFEYLQGHSSWPVTLPLNILLLQAWFSVPGLRAVPLTVSRGVFRSRRSSIFAFPGWPASCGAGGRCC